MNELIAQEKVLKNKSTIQQINLYLHCIILLASPFIMMFILKVTANEFGLDASMIEMVKFFFGLIFVAGSLNSVLLLFLHYRLLSPLKLTVQGIWVRQGINQERLVRWDEISAISKHQDSYSMPLPFEKVTIWKIETLLPPRFSLNSEKRFQFYITNQHEQYRDIISLLEEKSGVKIAKPTKKPKIPPWQPGSTR